MLVIRVGSQKSCIRVDRWIPNRCVGDDQVGPQKSCIRVGRWVRHSCVGDDQGGFSEIMYQGGSLGTQ